MEFKVFYCFYKNDEVVNDEENVSMKLEDIHGKLLDQLAEDGDFFGVIDSDNNTFQVLYDAEENIYWGEIPVPEKEGSMGSFFTKEDLTELLKNLKEPFDANDFPNFEFMEWEDDEFHEDEEDSQNKEQ